MPDVKPMKEASQEVSTDLGTLREDIARLAATVSELAGSQASAAKSTVMDTVGTAKQKISESAADVQGRARAMSSDIGAAIESNPFVAVLTALCAGLLIGMMSGARR